MIFKTLVIMLLIGIINELIEIKNKQRITIIRRERYYDKQRGT